MARSRNIKPGLFKNEILGVADPIYTLAFEGLWLLADRSGRLEDRPIRIRGEIFPYRVEVDMNGVLAWLSDNGFIYRYEVGGIRYIEIAHFSKHQNPHKNEAESEIPPYTPIACTNTEKIGTTTEKIGATRADSLNLIPDSLNLIPDSVDEPPDLFEEAWKRYPKRSGNNPKADALKAWNARIKGGVSAEVMQAGAERYRAWCEATGKIGTEHVMQAATFFGPSSRYEQSFELPKTDKHPEKGPIW